ncbi:hypothetical protein AVEN_266478-1 [Araneus ventricosus]|uniref:Uncharacterized protein n=1 Tax=Araneus ventricosus TaxID=182803 RepID=A0A4Y2E1C9_ARAVE|nr:hypothetical protein AVEN_266478-1 [Araneus ventricosus]
MTKEGCSAFEAPITPIFPVLYFPSLCVIWTCALTEFQAILGCNRETFLGSFSTVFEGASAFSVKVPCDAGFQKVIFLQSLDPADYLLTFRFLKFKSHLRKHDQSGENFPSIEVEWKCSIEPQWLGLTKSKGITLDCRDLSGGEGCLFFIFRLDLDLPVSTFQSLMSRTIGFVQSIQGVHLSVVEILSSYRNLI